MSRGSELIHHFGLRPIGELRDTESDVDLLCALGITLIRCEFSCTLEHRVNRLGLHFRLKLRFCPIRKRRDAENGVDPLRTLGVSFIRCELPRALERRLCRLRLALCFDLRWFTGRRLWIGFSGGRRVLARTCLTA